MFNLFRKKQNHSFEVLLDKNLEIQRTLGLEVYEHAKTLKKISEVLELITKILQELEDKQRSDNKIDK